MLKGEKAHERFSNLAEFENQEPLLPLFFDVSGFWVVSLV